MAVPTKFIDKDKFTELMKAEGDMVILYKLTNIPFDQPTPKTVKLPTHKRVGINVLLMNVTEPVIYKDPDNKQVFVLINGYDSDATFTYENFNDIHYIKNAWGYRLAPSYWDPNDSNDDMDDAIWVFKHTTREGQGLDEV